MARTSAHNELCEKLKIKQLEIDALINDYMVNNLQKPIGKNKLNLNAINRKANCVICQALSDIGTAVDNIRMSGGYSNLWE